MGLDVNQQSLAFDQSNTGQAVGTNDANNAFSSALVAANEDGSILERLEQVQEAVNKGTGTALAANKSLVDALGTDGSTITDAAASVLGVIGADNANNAFASTNVVANRDGSLLERSEFDIQSGEKCIANSSQMLSSGATLFTIANGPVAIISMQAVCQSENSGGAATTLQWRNAPTVGTANTFTGASATLASAVAGSTVSLDGTALTTAPTVLLTGGAQLSAIREIIVQAGTITSTVANGPSTASYIHYLRYRPLTPTAVVS